MPFFLLFLLILGGLSYWNLWQLPPDERSFDTAGYELFDKDAILKQKQAASEQRFNENFFQKMFFVEKYGKLQKLLGKRLVDDSIESRRVYRGKEDMLYYIIPDKNINDHAVRNIAHLRDELSQIQIPTVVVLPPSKHSQGAGLFPDDVLDYSLSNAMDLATKLREVGIPTLNLSENYADEGLDDASSFYLTDTHWRNRTAFWGYQKTLDFFEQQFGHHFYNVHASNQPASYRSESFHDTYIGSMGKRTGKDYLNRKDDYELLLPTFYTQYRYQKFSEEFELLSEKAGSFEEAFVNRSVFDAWDPYIDKYTVMMDYGQPYEVILNENVPDASKIVIIRDSFAMPYSAYLSTNVSALYLMDTRYGNIRTQLLDTIRNIQPDCVLFVFSPTSVFYFPELFAFGADEWDHSH